MQLIRDLKKFLQVTGVGVIVGTLMIVYPLYSDKFSSAEKVFYVTAGIISILVVIVVSIYLAYGHIKIEREKRKRTRH